MDKNERIKILDRAKKLHELSERGVDGEKENAKKILKQYCEKYNITDDELKSHKIFDKNQFKRLSEKEIIEMMASQIANAGFFLLSKAFKNARMNHEFIKKVLKFKNVSELTINWEYNENKFYHSCYVDGIKLYDIQVTKYGFTVYPVNSDDAVKFTEFKEAKTYVENLIKLSYAR